MKVTESAAGAKAGRRTGAEAEAIPPAGVLVIFVRQGPPQTRAVRGIFHVVPPGPHPVLHHPSTTEKTK